MTRQESFEIHYADQHDVPVETMAQYRWKDKDGYRLPGISSAYRNYCAGWDEGVKKTFATVAPHITQCLVCGAPTGHGGLPCPSMRLVGSIVPMEIKISMPEAKTNEQ